MPSVAIIGIKTRGEGKRRERGKVRAGRVLIMSSAEYGLVSEDNADFRQASAT